MNFSVTDNIQMYFFRELDARVQWQPEITRIMQQNNNIAEFALALWDNISECFLSVLSRGGIHFYCPIESMLVVRSRETSAYDWLRTDTARKGNKQ